MGVVKLARDIGLEVKDAKVISVNKINHIELLSNYILDHSVNARYVIDSQGNHYFLVFKGKHDNPFGRAEVIRGGSKGKGTRRQGKR